MDNDLFKNQPILDVSYSYNLASSVQNNIRKSQEEALRISQEAYENRQRMQKALEQTAENTLETNIQLKQVVENQNSYIQLLKKQLEYNEKQVAILQSIFSSEDECLLVEKELLELIKKQIDSSHPLWDMIKDKAGDVAVTGITAGAPLIYNAVKALLSAKGILLP